MSDQEALTYINNNPMLLSCLYDVNLLPEQLKRDSDDWKTMLKVVAKFKETKDKLESSVS